MELTAVLTPAGEGGYVALNPETGTTTQGETVEEAVANLREATILYRTEISSRGPWTTGCDHLLSFETCLNCPMSLAPKR